MSRTFIRDIYASSLNFKNLPFVNILNPATMEHQNDSWYNRHRTIRLHYAVGVANKSHNRHPIGPVRPLDRFEVQTSAQ